MDCVSCRLTVGTWAVACLVLTFGVEYYTMMNKKLLTLIGSDGLTNGELRLDNGIGTTVRKI
jgi:hypothetical protein